MRIVSGKYGGRRLDVPKNRDIRPTTDKVRGAVFNMLASRMCLDGARVLDAFCGSGALGLEALSRGAVWCTFMDKARPSLDLVRLNAQNLQAVDHADFILKNALKIGMRPDGKEAYTLVFLDPPYHKGMVDAMLPMLTEGDWLADGAFIVCETEKRAMLKMPTEFILENEKLYGEIKVSLLRYQPITPV